MSEVTRQGTREPVRLFGRSSSHNTRLPRIFAEELGVPYELVPIPDMTAMDAEVYGGNPALKLPSLKAGGTTHFGAQNICRRLAELAASKLRLVWTEDLREADARNAQELVWHCYQTQVHMVFGTIIARLPADNVYFVKAAAGFRNSLGWLEERWPAVRGALPPRDLSLLEASLFCLIEHLAFRKTLSAEPYVRLQAFAREFAQRASARATPYRFDA